jgi:hypothetical protein
VKPSSRNWLGFELADSDESKVFTLRFYARGLGQGAAGILPAKEIGRGSADETSAAP